ncbi:RluA family pseudouridine synthase [Mycoplasma marinum]|uniref:Pseudouridine synthase n=1 Tax=Mycoplasma marinum TaxID=1937190 RepID=A0A4R0XQB5_9MOLU|nr:RluA family pseudouridine synthase [Mycoplasma marinum]TCG11765.1 RluA family pseudouridine synthase [Mycoplasma marinum]
MEKLVARYTDRIDKYIADNTSISRTDVQTLIKGHAIEVDGISVRKANFKVNEGNEIKVTRIVQREINIIAQEMELNVVYEDDDIIVINKPSGLVVHPAPGHPNGTLVNGLMHRFKGQLSDINGEVRPGIVHRIDKDTSGLLVVAKNNRAHAHLAQEIKDHKVERTYMALVKGRVTNEITHIDLPIGRDSKHRQRMAVQRQNSKHAKTHVFIEKVMENTTLVRCELETGRTHQIRVHLNYIGHPIIGDPLYGTKIDDFGQRLHAYQLKLLHPNGEVMFFEAPVPKEFFENVKK